VVFFKKLFNLWYVYNLRLSSIAEIRMKRTTCFITGTDTGVGKTVLTALLARYWRARGFTVAALKPVCSGDRADARVLRAALAGALTLDEINPWHYPAPVAPLLAARRAGGRVRLAGVRAHIRKMQKRFEVVLVEGAGGLLSPLGEDFNSRDLIAALRATPLVVGPNRIGAVNQVLLTLAALPRAAAARARVVLISPPRPDAATPSNAGLLAEFFEAERIFELPWLGGRFEVAPALKNPQLQRTLQMLTRS
jgi:dethiobiotin synthetase